MPKINIIGMVVLCLAVFAGAAAMALRSSPPRVDTARVDRLIRRLGDHDPDLRREAERELKDLGRKAEPALKEAAGGSDAAIAERARAILGMKSAEVKQATGSSEVISEPVKAADVRLTLQLGSSPVKPEEPALYYLRLHNDTRKPVAIARRVREGRPDYRAFGAFERIDSEGRLAEIVDGSMDDEGSTLDVVVVAPGESLDLFPGAGLLRIGGRGTFRIRYVYDASEGSEYRSRIASGHHAGMALRAERFESNTVVVTIP